MSEFLMPAAVEENEIPRTSVPPREGSIITLVGVVEGEVLERLESQGPSSLYRLIQAQDWPAPLVTMAVGALIRQGLVRGDQQRLEFVNNDDTRH